MPLIYGYYAYVGVYIMNNNIHDEIDELLNINKKKKKLYIGRPPKKEEKKEIFNLDTIQEQVEAPMTTAHCPQSIKKNNLKDISRNPENYIEINFIKNIRLVDSFYIPSNIKNFNYKNIEYIINEENVYILPTKKGYFMPTCFYKEGNNLPIDFKQKNQGITGKALSLLYDPLLFMDLFSGEEGKYNLFVVILLIGSITSFLVGLYFVLGGTV